MMQIITAATVLAISSYLLRYWYQATKMKTKSIGMALPNEGAPRRSTRWPKLVSTMADTQTLYDSWQNAVRKYGNRKCLGTRMRNVVDGKLVLGKYEWKTYAQVNARVEHFGSGLAKLGINRQDKIGLFAKNREDWIVVQQACFNYNLVVVAFYETLGETSLQFVANHSVISVAVCTLENLKRLLAIKAGCPSLKTVIVMDKFNEADKKSAADVGIDLLYLGDVEEEGERNAVPHDPPKPSDLCGIMYTSGATGDPKGVMHTHSNFVAELAAVFQFLVLTDDDFYLSYLPLAHVLERLIISIIFQVGAPVGFFNGDMRLMTDDIVALAPTLLVGVPRVFDRIKDGVTAAVKKGSIVARTLFRLAFAYKKFAIRYGFPTFFVDALVFKKIQNRVGGRVRAVISGGAPLSMETELFMRVCVCDVVSQGYGLTETLGGSCVKMFDDPSMGSVGVPVPCNEIKLVDVPEMNYSSADKPFPRGEIALRGANVAHGYFKDEKKTAEDFRDGWFHTGDIGQWNADGTLQIIDRKKNIFKLSQGEYVASEKIENVVSSGSELIAQIFLYGDSLKTHLVGIVVPNKVNLEAWAQANNVPAADFAALCATKEARELVLKHICQKGREAKLFGFELPKSVYLSPDEWNTDNDLLTPSFKLKRPKLKEAFKSEIETMYAEAPATE